MKTKTHLKHKIGRVAGSSLMIGALTACSLYVFHKDKTKAVGEIPVEVNLAQLSQLPSYTAPVDATLANASQANATREGAELKNIHQPSSSPITDGKKIKEEMISADMSAHALGGPQASGHSMNSLKKGGGYGGVYPSPGATPWEFEHNTENYSHMDENKFRLVKNHPLSTFSLDVDTASYSNMRRFITSGVAAPRDAIRIEELLNYFPYSYTPPTKDKTFAIHVEKAQAPWKAQHGLVKIGIKAKDIEWGQRPNSNLVFLLDVSGSMQSPDKLPLVKQSLKMLVEQLGEKDRIAIVVYAGAAGVVLASTEASQKSQIFNALDRLEAGGSTNGAGGIVEAYKEAEKHFIKGGINRVLLATDGDFNVGVSSEGALVELIKEKAKSNVFLTILGFGSGNLKDSHMQKIANNGNGVYAYIDSEKEAKKVLVSQAGGTLMTVAKDVKLQVEFNPQVVAGYRLIGYEKRLLQNEDFNDDKKDAGDIGAGHTITALYEVVPAGQKVPNETNVDALKYQTPNASSASGTSEMLTVKLRYKEPEASKSQLISETVANGFVAIQSSSPDMQFAAAVASFGMLARNSEFKGETTWTKVLDLAKRNTAKDTLREEFVELVTRAEKIYGSKVSALSD